MKTLLRTLMGVLILSLSINCWAMDINRFHSGSWWNSSQSGHGFSIEFLNENQLLIYWYVYNPDGTSTFLLAVAEINRNTAGGIAYYYSGMRFGEFDNTDLIEEEWGTITIIFHGCQSATLQYSSTMSYDGVPFGSGSIPLTRLVGIDHMQCSDSPYAGIYQGNFYSQITGEVIAGEAVVSPDGKFAAFSLDAMAGTGNWSVIGNSFSGSGTAVSANPDFSFSANLTISGEIMPEYRFVGSYNVAGGDRGTFDFFAIPEVYRRGISLQAIAGNYTGRNLVTGASGSASVTSNGSLSGSDSQGCTYGGQLTLPDAQFNVFKVTITVSNCGATNGEYKGYGAQIDYFNLGDGRGLRLVATDGSYAGLIDLYR